MPENKKFWKFCNQAGNKVELLLYGDISQKSWWGGICRRCDAFARVRAPMAWPVAGGACRTDVRTTSLHALPNWFLARPCRIAFALSRRSGSPACGHLG